MTAKAQTDDSPDLLHFFLVEDCRYEYDKNEHKLHRKGREDENCLLITEEDWTNLSQELLRAEIIQKDGDTYCVKFVGLICYKNKLYPVLPKYCTSLQDEDLEKRFVSLMRLLKYRRKELFRQDILDTAESGALSNLWIQILILDDYDAYGLYRDDTRMEQINGAGSIQWQRTIQTMHPVFQEGKPYYLSMRTSTTVINENNFFTRLHKSIASACQKELQKLRLHDILSLPVFTDLDDEAEVFDNWEHLEKILEAELGIQFDTRRRQILELMLAYVKEMRSDTTASEHNIVSFGTIKFEHVWEDVCRTTLGEDKHMTAEWQEPLENNKPAWHISGKDYKGDKRRTDMIFINEEDKIIELYDAKYYVIPSDLPKNEDITKQYMYQLMLLHHEPNREYKIRNCLIFPACNNSPSKCVGYVHMPFLSELGLENIQVWQIAPDMLYECYLRSAKMSIGEIESVGEPVESKELKKLYLSPKD